MRSEWPRSQIGELVANGAALLQTGPFGSQLHKHDYVQRGIPVIPTEAIGRGAIRTDISLPQVTEVKAMELSRHKLKRGDILFARRGAQATGLSAVVGHEHEGALCGTGAILLRVDHDVIDPFFLAAVLATDDAYDWLRAHAVGAVMPNLNTGIISQFVVPVPELSDQREVAATVQALVRRIESLRQTNATLESIAQALFKSWFVDFDAVRAKAEGREPQGMDAATAALFPSEFEESALGLIPKGWTVVEVGQSADCVGGGTPSTKEAAYWEPAVYHWATPKDLSGLGSPVLLGTERCLSPAGLAKVSSGLLPAGTLLMSSRAPIGYLAIAQIPVAVNQGFIAIRPGGLLPPVYLYFWCQTNMDAIKQKANGSTFMEISKAAFRPIPLALPPEEVVMRFADVAGALFARIAEGERHRAQLAEIRDALLPRLISGKLRLPEAKQLLEPEGAIA